MSKVKLKFVDKIKALRITPRRLFDFEEGSTVLRYLQTFMAEAEELTLTPYKTKYLAKFSIN